MPFNIRVIPDNAFPVWSLTTPPTPNQVQPESGFLFVDGIAVIEPATVKNMPTGRVFIGWPMVAVGGTNVRVGCGVSEASICRVEDAKGVPNDKGRKVGVGVHVAGNTCRVGVAVGMGVDVDGGGKGLTGRLGLEIRSRTYEDTQQVPRSINIARMFQIDVRLIFLIVTPGLVTLSCAIASPLLSDQDVDRTF